MVSGDCEGTSVGGAASMAKSVNRPPLRSVISPRPASTIHARNDAWMP